MGLLVIILLGLGLCFDTFAVSVGAGMGCNSYSRARGFRFALILGLFQGLMPFIGWLAAAEFHSLIAVWDHWIAFGLLLILGVKMIYSGVTGKAEAPKNDPFTLRNSFLMGFATSIDALIAGVTLALVKVNIIDNASAVANILVAVAIIAIITVGASLLGIAMGKGSRGCLGARAEIIGGVILILIGAKVLYEHLNELPPMKEPVKAMSFNIRYDNPDDGAHNWNFRNTAILEMLSDQKPDLLGIQEGLAHQVAFLDSALATYKYIGVGRDDGDKAGEYAAIFYDTTRLAALQTGNFWLSDTCTRPAMGWDAVCVRIATWGLFQDKLSGHRFFAVNTHFDHIGTTARTESGKLIIRKIDSIASGTPLVLMGDFNCTVADGTLDPILEKMQLARPEDSTEPAYTFIGFDMPADSPERQIIDHIFVRSIFAKDYTIITNTYGAPAGQLSDHLPVAVNLFVKS